MLEQISVFIENKKGRLASVMEILNNNKIDIRALTIADTTDFGIIRIVVKDAKTTLSILKENDILVSIAGALGRTSFVEKEMLPCNCNQAVAFIRINENIDFVPQYICYCIMSRNVQTSLLSQVKKTAQPNLTLEHIKNIKIPFPTYEEQLEITKKIESLFE